MSSRISKKNSDMILSVLSGFYGEVKPDLQFSNIYELTIAVVISAQTTDRQVNGVTGELFRRYPDFASLAEADIADVEKIIKSTGFFHTKAKNIVNLALMVSGKYGGVLPDEMDKLLELPGVGRKSANVILSIGYGLPGLAVDTHVGRIAKRLGYTESDDPRVAERDLCSIIPQDNWRETHLLFINHGRKICRSRNPECGVCPISADCAYYRDITSP